MGREAAQPFQVSAPEVIYPLRMEEWAGVQLVEVSAVEVISACVTICPTPHPLEFGILYMLIQLFRNVLFIFISRLLFFFSS